jgi:hypothetical protein
MGTNLRTFNGTFGASPNAPAYSVEAAQPNDNVQIVNRSAFTSVCLRSFSAEFFDIPTGIRINKLYGGNLCEPRCN